MPTLYVDRPLLDVVRNRKKRMERRAEQAQGEEVYVPEKEALETMLSDDAMDEVRRERGDDV